MITKCICYALLSYSAYFIYIIYPDVTIHISLLGRFKYYLMISPISCINRAMNLLAHDGTCFLQSTMLCTDCR